MSKNQQVQSQSWERGHVGRVSRLLATSAGVLCFTVASGGASAQTMDQGEEKAPTEVADTETEIVVFARRRAENVQDVPIAVSVLPKSVIDNGNLDELREFIDLVPGATFSDDSNTSSEISIRGSGRNLQAEDQSVGIYVDGIYIGGRIVSTANFYDVAGVEVLRGPQAGLYGRNAVGGALSVTTERPSGEFEGYVDLQIASQQRYEARAAINVPIVDDTWAIRVAGLRIDQDRGFDYIVNQDQYVDAQEVTSVRIRSSVTPNERLELLTTFEYLKSEGGGGLTVAAPDADRGFLDQDEVFPIPGTRPSDTRNQQRNRRQQRDLEQFQFVQEANLATDAGTITGLLSYRSADFISARDEDLSPFDVSDLVFDTSQDSLFAELRFASDFDGPFSFVTGITYLDEKTNIGLNNRIGGAFAGSLGGASIAELFSTGVVTPSWAPVLGLPVGTPISALGLTPGATGWGGFLGDTFPSEFVNDQKLESIAAFAELNYKLTDRLEIWANGRYTEDRKSIDFAQTFGIPSRCPVACGQIFSLLFDGLEPEFAGTGDATFKSFNPAAGANFSPSDDALVYAKVVTGFKAGGFNSIAATRDLLAFDEETTISYEIGAKTAWFNNRLTVNAAAYLQTRKDALVSVLDPALPIATVGVNAGRIENQGFELEFSSRPFKGLQLQGAFGYVDSKFEEFEVFGVDFSGNNVPRNFKYTLSLVASYTHPISERTDLFGFVNYRNAWDGYIGSDNAEKMSNPELVDMRLGFKGERWKFVGFVDNVFNRRFTTTEFNEGRRFGVFSPGRTFGLQGVFNF